MNEIEKLQIIPSKSGDNTLLIDGKFIHSKYNPKNEGNSDVYEKKSIVIIFGIGLGYHLLNLVKNNPKCSFVIYDFHKNLLDNFCTNNNEFVQQNKNILFLYNFSYNDLERFFQTYCYYGTARLSFFKNAYLNLYPEIFLQYQNFVKQTYELYIQNMLTKSNFTHLWTKNFIYNVSNLINKPLISFNTQQTNLDEHYALIVCAGPTTKYEFENIKKYRDKFTLFAVDAAVKPLLRQEIYPDFILTVDGQIYSFDDFPTDLPQQCTLIADILSYPQISQHFDNIFFTINDAFYNNSISKLFFDKLKYQNIEQSFINISGTVANYALNVVLKFGFSKIIFVGLDLSYPNLTTHLTHTPVYDRLLFSSGYFSSLDTKFCSIIAKRKLIDKESKNHTNVISDFVLQNYALGFENIDLKSSKIEIYNVKNNGINISNFKNTTLNQILSHSTSCNKKQEILETKLKTVYIKKEQIIATLNQICDEIYNISNEIKTLYEQTDWNENSYIEQWENELNKTFNLLPMLKQFLIMQDIIKNKTAKENVNLAFYQNYAITLLQSCYFLIRTLQKSVKQLS